MPLGVTALQWYSSDGTGHLHLNLLLHAFAEHYKAMLDVMELGESPDFTGFSFGPQFDSKSKYIHV